MTETESELRPAASPTAAQLQAIRERADRATPGPWSVDDTPADYLSDYLFLEDGEEHRVRDACWLEGPAFIDMEENGNYLHRADAEFVANARSDVPALLDALAAEREMCDALADALEALCSHASREPEAPESYEPALRALLAWSASREADRG